MSSKYVAFDVDRIKEFVFSAQRPMDIAAASSIVRDLDKPRENGYLKGFDDAEIIYCAGGGGLLQIEGQDRADSLARHLEDAFRTRSVIGSLTAVITEAPTDGSSQFPYVIQKLSAQLRIGKARKASSEFATTYIAGGLDRCEGCGIYGGEFTHNAGPNTEQLCDSCSNLRRSAKRGQPHLAEIAHGKSEMDEQAGGYVAFLKLDVNGAGGLLHHCKYEREAAALSTHISGAMAAGRRAAEDLFGNFLLDPVVGGDDLALFFQGKDSAIAAINILDAIDKALREVPSELHGTDVGNRLEIVTVGAGLLVAPSHMPVKFVFDIGTQLETSAKAKASNTCETTIDFMVLKGAAVISDTMEAARRELYRRDVGTAHFPDRDGRLETVHRVWRTRRPYSLSELSKLHNGVTSLRGQSEVMSQLRRIDQALDQSSPMEAFIYSAYQRSRLDGLAAVDVGLLHRIEKVAEITNGGSRTEFPAVTSGIADALDLAWISALSEGKPLNA